MAKKVAFDRKDTTQSPGSCHCARRTHVCYTNVKAPSTVCHTARCPDTVAERWTLQCVWRTRWRNSSSRAPQRATDTLRGSAVCLLLTQHLSKHPGARNSTGRPHASHAPNAPRRHTAEHWTLQCVRRTHSALHSQLRIHTNQFMLHTISAANTSTLAGLTQRQIFPATTKLKTNVD